MPMQNKHDSLDLISMFSIASALFASHSVSFFKDLLYYQVFQGGHKNLMQSPNRLDICNVNNKHQSMGKVCQIFVALLENQVREQPLVNSYDFTFDWNFRSFPQQMSVL